MTPTATVIDIDLIRARRRIEAKIDELVALLDLIDGDPDLEPYVGWASIGRGYTDGESHDEAEDEREDDVAERGIADLDALNLTMQEEDWFGTLCFDGTGNIVAGKMLKSTAASAGVRA
ncbi:hypothetical protein [Ensifer aridi]|uniref:hypothetical protein n=1 Tax=Ensifer aridi TaxID=1708715 RepID=UPI001124FF11|nr:hypothetical protein [Ensifer aridi]